MVQHFDHVLHHLTSAIKEHVPPTAQHDGKRQRGLMEAIVIKFFEKWSRTHSVIIFEKHHLKRRSKFGNLGFETNYNVLPSISDIRCEVPELRGDNFKIWKERILLQLGCMDIDYAIRKDEPHKITDTNKNRLGICGSIEQHENVRELLKAIDEQFLTGIRGVREHIMEMRDIVAQLKKLEVEMSESFLVHFILNTLPPQYGPFKISYNTHKDKWSINELMTMCVQEEGRLLMEQGESAMLVKQRKGKKGKSQASQKGKQQIPPKSDIK
ncbi:hypothetical protein AAG906_011816 [Vitis piasezkii]